MLLGISLQYKVTLFRMTGSPKYTSDDTIKMYVKEVWCSGFIWLRAGLAISSCEHGNEILAPKY
jgi:hypothetical protein